MVIMGDGRNVSIDVIFNNNVSFLLIKLNYH
jgi:hypothetical protein